MNVGTKDAGPIGGTGHCSDIKAAMCNAAPSFTGFLWKGTMANSNSLLQVLPLSILLASADISARVPPKNFPVSKVVRV